MRDGVGAKPRAARRPSTSRYELLELLGAGGFGEVYRARYLGPMGFVRDVAIKLLHNDVDSRAQPVERLRDEARILGMLSHPNIVQVLRPAVIEGRWAIVMEHCEGVSLSSFVGNEGAPPRYTMPTLCVLELLEVVAGALLHAYEARGPDGAPLRVLHRDLKPSNLHLTLTGHLKLLDFGVAHGLFEAREAATDMIVMGTLSYMAPERLRGEDGPAGDVFALGVTAIELLTGLPYGSPSQDGMSAALLWERARGRLGRLLPGVEALLRSLISRRAAERPGLAQLRDEARALRRSVDAVDVTLADWAAEVVPPTLERLRGRHRAKPSRVGQILHEQSIGTVLEEEPLFGAVSASQLAQHPLAPAATTASQDRPQPAPPTVPVSFPEPRPPRRAARVSGGALRGFGLSGLVAVGAVVIGFPVVLAGGLAYHQARSDMAHTAAIEEGASALSKQAAPGPADDAPVAPAPAPLAPTAPKVSKGRGEPPSPLTPSTPPSTTPSVTASSGAVWVSVSGNVNAVVVTTPRGPVHLPASLSPGRYPMSVQFAQAEDPTFVTLDVPAGSPLRLRCMWEFLNCVHE